ncbi:unnamed protein product [Blepharisma stoltei]|uniref:Caffeoyl-CoA O-methyltransferase n=1 Tax=Blepharisma stoltei TaxID=1481888 RepID=A0AAU9ICM1_9CILI|nr:unnamed protein product [Blepharisma stoltei]
MNRLSSVIRRINVFNIISRYSGTAPLKTSISDESLSYIYNVGIRNSPIKEDLLNETKQLYPEIAQMSTDRIEGDFIEILIQSLNAKKCLEVGVFTGFSSLCAALGLPDDGKIIALDISDEFTSIARKYWERAGVSHKIDLKIGPALDNLHNLRREGHENSFDFAFLDADKENYLKYYENIIPLMRKGGVVLIDNIIFHNRVVDETNNGEDVKCLRLLNEWVTRDKRVKSVALPFADGIFMVTKK